MMCDDHRIETLIAEVEHYPMLYNKLDPNFKNVTKKRDVWQEIGMRTGMGGDMARKRWANLRDAFNSSRKKAAGDKVIKKYKFADVLSFLRPHLPEPVQYRESSSNLEMVESVSDEEHYNSIVSIVEHNEDEYNQIQQHHHHHHDNASFVSVLSTSPPHSSAKKRRHANVDLNHSIVDYLAKKARVDAEKDDLDYFFCSMAETLRRMPERTRVELKFDIYQMVHKVELDLLSKQIKSEDN